MVSAVGMVVVVVVMEAIPSVAAEPEPVAVVVDTETGYGGVVASVGAVAAGLLAERVVEVASSPAAGVSNAVPTVLDGDTEEAEREDGLDSPAPT